MEEACFELDIRSFPTLQLSPQAMWSVWMYPPDDWVLFRSVLDFSNQQGIFSLKNRNILQQYTYESNTNDGMLCIKFLKFLLHRVETPDLVQVKLG